MHYENVQKNKRKTSVIIALFALMIYIASYAILQMFELGEFSIVLATIITVLTTFISYWNSDKIVLKSVNARPATTYEEQNLETMLDSLCIAAGIKERPRLYIIDSNQMNAFATGRNKENAVICLTTGIISRLNRQELEAVVAHELTHITNSDILLSAVLSAMGGFLVILADISRRMIFRRSNNSNSNSNSNPLNLILFIVGILLLILAPIISNFLQLFVSRKREYMADAGAVGLTRNPQGMISALVKIHEDTEIMEDANRATDMSFIASPYVAKREFQGKSSLWSSHPTLEERVKAIRELI